MPIYVIAITYKEQLTVLSGAALSNFNVHYVTYPKHAFSKGAGLAAVI